MFIKHIFLLILILMPLKAYSFEVSITAGDGLLYLRVGDGGFSGRYDRRGTPLNLSTVNKVSTSLTQQELLNSFINNNAVVNKAMTTDGTIIISHYDNYVFCNLPDQLYIGGFYRRPNNYSNSPAVLVATVPNGLTNEMGQIIPFNKISYTSSGNSEAAGAYQPFGSKTFNSGSMTIGNIPKNRWSESCHKFTYAHNGFLAGGTYKARVIYTLTTP